MNERTRGPWKVYEGSKGWLIESPFDDGPIAEVPRMDDAELIVRACNSHAGLLEALHKIGWVLHSVPLDIRSIARNAIEKAKGDIK